VSAMPATAITSELLLPAGMPGFPDDRRWTITELEADSPFAVLASRDTEGLELLVALPFSFFPDWDIELADADAERLGITDPSEVLVLVIVTSGEHPEDATANLLAPIIIHVGTGIAAQVVLRAGIEQVRRPLFSALVCA
jgi:flagellar assembly factor FliW